jgi:DNA-binding NtrC family response regulator
VAGPKLTVIADSDIVRESIAIALGDRYPLIFVAARDAATNLPPSDLVILESPTADAARRTVDAAGSPTLRIVCSGPAAGDGDLGFPFYPESLRAAVQRALGLPRRVAPTANAELDYPLIPHGAATIAAKAAASGLPALICGARGSGTRRLARQIHARAGGARFVAVPAAGFGADLAASLRGECSTGLTLCIDRIDAMPATAMEHLAALLDDGVFGAVAHGPRLLCTAESDPDTIIATSVIDPDLFYRLAVLPIHLPALCTRLDDLPAIAAVVLARLAERHAPDARPRLGSDALARLSRYAWPGNLAELEAVLARSLVFCRTDVLGAGDLLFDIAAADRAPAVVAIAAAHADPDPPGDAPVPEPAAPDGRDHELDLLLQELAHELKNPMVTIKTVAQHLERLLDEESGQREMARMTGEAVDRMDRALENLLDFTRFGEPVPRGARLADIVGECFETMDPEFAAHRILLDERVDPGATVVADRGQLVYALDNLLRAIVRVAGDGATLVVRSPLARSGLDLEFPTTTASITAALARWSDGAPPGTAIAASIPFVFARALVERNGGSVQVRPGEGKTTVSVALPEGSWEAEEDEETAYPDR